MYARRFFVLSFMILLMYVLPVTFAHVGYQKTERKEMILFEFAKSAHTDDWLIINDGVMGGLSRSEIILSEKNTAIFQGTVSLENNGGFASTRTRPRSYKLDGYDGIILRVKGDGKKYQFRLRTSDRFDGIAYSYHFQTESNKWAIVQVPFEECVPVFRGRIMGDVAPLSAAQIRQIGFMISDKQEGPFTLEIDWIKTYKSE